MRSEARDPRNFTLAEWQQAKRAGYDPRVLKETIQECWAVSDGRDSFRNALEERGFLLAKGDRRGHVVLDFQGEVYALSRALNLKAKDIRAKLGAEDSLPSVQVTRAHIAERMTPAIRTHVQEAKIAFQRDAAMLAFEKAQVAQKHQEERVRLERSQQERRLKEERDRQASLPRGLKGLWARLTGKYKKLQIENEAVSQAARVRDSGERERQIAAQLRERQLLETRIKSLRGRQAQQLAELRQDVLYFMKLGRMTDDAPVQDRVRRLKR